MNRLIIIIPLLFLLYGQSYAQWQKTNLPSSSKVNTLAISDSSIYAGTEGDGIFVSKDNGETWNSINEGLQNKVIHSIFINGTTIFAGTEAGASLSTNNGLNWSTINSGLAGKGVWSFAINNFMPGNSTIFAGTWSGVYYSTNNGTSWQTTGLSNTTMPVNSIVVCNNFVFAATLAGGVFKSYGGGFGWEDISINIKDEYTLLVVAIMPVYSLAAIDSYIIASAGAGSGSFYRMKYTDSLFTIAGAISSRYQPNLSLAIRNSILFAGSLIGDFILTNNDGSNWDHSLPSLTNETIYSLALNNLFIFAGTENGIWRLSYPETSTNVSKFKELPTGFSLEQNYPNPFNPTTAISYKLSAYSHVSLKVYDVLGREVATLVNENKPEGNYKVEFNTNKLVSGIYFYTMQAGAFVQTKKLILLK
jgi:photosystem II stability/assembly factor-like uncharacterized protein